MSEEKRENPQSKTSVSQIKICFGSQYDTLISVLKNIQLLGSASHHSIKAVNELCGAFIKNSQKVVQKLEQCGDREQNDVKEKIKEVVELLHNISQGSHDNLSGLVEPLLQGLPFFDLLFPNSNLLSLLRLGSKARLEERIINRDPREMTSVVEEARQNEEKGTIYAPFQKQPPYTVQASDDKPPSVSEPLPHSFPDISTLFSTFTSFFSLPRQSEKADNHREMKSVVEESRQEQDTSAIYGSV